MIVVVTGSREWVDVPTIRDAMEQVRSEGADILYHGNAQGADKSADWYGRGWGWEVRPFPIGSHTWKRHHEGAYHPKAELNIDPCPRGCLRPMHLEWGWIRNNRMVEAAWSFHVETGRPIVALAFPKGVAKGTRDCKARLEYHGIEVRDFGEQPDSRQLTFGG